VVSESACFGLPVIISDRVGCIGPNDSAQPGRNAIVYPCGDIQRLADAIERLYRSRDLYNRMSQESLRIAQSQDVVGAARQLACAVRSLYELGSRKSAAANQSLLRSEATSL
jgi:glycosyltransferase involved in cell wall biosynthesis